MPWLLLFQNNRARFPCSKRIKPEQIKVKLNLSKSVVGINKLSVTQENIVLPPGIRLKKIEPSELDVTLDTLIEKGLYIQPYFIGKLPKAFYEKGHIQPLE